MQRTITVALAAALTIGAAGATQASVLNGARSTVGVQRLAVAALDAPIALNQWYTFGFNGVGSSFANGSIATDLGVNPTSLSAPDPNWTFTLPSTGGTLIVADGYLSGDQFNLTDNGTSIGNTSVPTLGDVCGFDITACLADPNFSKGTFALAGGAHAINGTAIASPFASGAAFFEVTSSSSPVPEPVSIALLGSGLLGLGIASRRRA